MDLCRFRQRPSHAVTTAQDRKEPPGAGDRAVITIVIRMNVVIRIVGLLRGWTV